MRGVAGLHLGRSIAALGMTFLIALAPTARAEQSVCDAEHMPPWAAKPLTKTERAARLYLYAKDDRLKNFTSGNAEQVKKCDGLLQQLQSFKGIRILNPAYRAVNPDTIIDGPPGSADNAAKTIAPSCTNLDLDQEYRTDPYPYSPAYVAHPSPFRRDAEFLSKPRKEKMYLSKEYFTATKNIEFYDLSSYFNADIWGYFAEGARSSLITAKGAGGCSGQYITIEKIFNGKTCQVAYEPYALPVRRSYFGWDGKPQQTPENYGMYVFAEMGGALYRLTLAVSSREGPDFYQIARPFFISIFLDEVKNTKDGPSVERQCSFSTDKEHG